MSKTLSGTGTLAYLSGAVQNVPTRWVLALFPGFLDFRSNAPKFHSSGGVCVSFLKSVRKGRFRNVGLGGLHGHIFVHRAANATMYTKHALHSLDRSVFRVRIVVIVAPLHKGWDPIEADIPMFVNGNIFLQFSAILQPLDEKAVASADVKISNMSSVQHADPGVPNSPFQGLSEYTPHTFTSRTLSWQK